MADAHTGPPPEETQSPLTLADVKGTLNEIVVRQRRMETRLVKFMLHSGLDSDGKPLIQTGEKNVI